MADAFAIHMIIYYAKRPLNRCACILNTSPIKVYSTHIPIVFAPT